MQTLLNLNLNQAQQLAWLHQHPSPATSREALARLLETTRLCLEAFDNEHIVSTQSQLEDVLIQTLIAMKTLDMQPEAALQRGLERVQQTTTQRAFHIFADHVEIRVQDDIRGEWMLYTQQDYEAALSLAHELGCRIVHEEAQQLGLFARGKDHADTPR